jgi:hypothetical protein
VHRGRAAAGVRQRRPPGASGIQRRPSDLQALASGLEEPVANGGRWTAGVHGSRRVREPGGDDTGARRVREPGYGSQGQPRRGKMIRFLPDRFVLALDWGGGKCKTTEEDEGVGRRLYAKCQMLSR